VGYSARRRSPPFAFIVSRGSVFVTISGLLAVYGKTDRSSVRQSVVKMSNVPPPPTPSAPLMRSQTTCAEYTRRPEPPMSRSVSSPVEFAATPTCPPPLQRSITNCCSSRFPAGNPAGFPEPPPSPPALRRTDTSADYAVLSLSTTDPMYDRWLIEDNFARLSAIEETLRKQMSDVGMIRESLYQLSKRLNDAPPAPSSPVTRQVADNTSPHYPFSTATVDMMNNFGM